MTIGDKLIMASNLEMFVANKLIMASALEMIIGKECPCMSLENDLLANQF